MLLKILLTISVILGAVMYLRMRDRPSTQQTADPARLPQTKDSRKTPIKVAAVGVAVLMILGAGAYTYHQWRDSYQVVSVRVIDTRSGTVTKYLAYKGDVEGRQFVTTDDVLVTLAEVERLELGGD